MVLQPNTSGYVSFLLSPISSYGIKGKSRKYQGVFEVKSWVKTWQVRGIWSQQLEHKQVPQWGTELLSDKIEKKNKSILIIYTVLTLHHCLHIVRIGAYCFSPVCVFVEWHTIRWYWDLDYGPNNIVKIALNSWWGYSNSEIHLPLTCIIPDEKSYWWYFLFYIPCHTNTCLM